MMRNPHGLIFLIAAFLLANILGYLPSAAAKDPEVSAGISALVKRKKLEIVNDPQALARVQHIVSNIYRVAEEHAGTTPEVAIVSGRPSAEAMEGRYILVSQSMVKLLDDDNELSIVLGHEIAHLVRGHTTGVQRESDVATAAEHLSFDQSLIPELQKAVSQGVEAEADRYGLLYAALAGYDVSRAPQVYDKVLTNLPDVNHPPKEERERSFYERLQNILDNVDVFNAGLDYALREQYAFSIRAYENLLRDDFRSRDIYLNLGAFHHLLAFRFLKPENSPPEICALSLELQSGFEPQGQARNSGAARGGKRADEGLDPKFLEHLNQAIDQYQQALRSSPDYAAAHNNLGCAFLHRQDPGDVYEAVGELERASKLEPTDAAIANNLGVAYLRIEQRDKALAQFRRALQLAPNFAVAEYNLGTALLSMKTAGAEAEARKAFQAYIKGEEGMRKAIYVSRARTLLGLGADPRETAAASKATAPQPVAQTLPLLPGQDLSHLSPDSHADREIKLIPEYAIEMLQFSNWKLLIRDEIADEITVDTDVFQTSEHIGVGSTLDQIRRAYGRADVERVQGDSRILAYLDKGLLFRVQNDHIKSWSVFQPR